MADLTFPLRTDAEHVEALAQIERLIDAEHGTPEGDRLERLTAEVDAYEREHYPIPPPTPEQAAAFAQEQGRPYGSAVWWDCSYTPEQALEFLSEAARTFWTRNAPEGAIRALGLDRRGPRLPGDPPDFYGRLPRTTPFHVVVSIPSKKRKL